MPTFAGQIGEDDLAKLVAYIESIGPSKPEEAAADAPANESYLNAKIGIRSWLFTTDHKRIALLYFAAITFFFAIGGLAATLIRFELITPGPTLGSPDFYNRLFTMHGVIMVWFFLIPSIPATMGNFVIPLMIGARDLAFPRLNLLSWYLFIVGGLITLTALLLGGLDTGWTFYEPYSTFYATGYVILAITGIFVAGFSSILTGLNFIVTIHKLRAPGMTWYRLPVFVWSTYATSLILVLATPVLAMTLLMLCAERVLHVGIFSPQLGGDPLLFQHMFWFYSHPAVYIMILPSMGVISEIVPVLLAQVAVRLPIRRVVQHRHRGDRLPGLGPPHVRRRAVALRQPRLLVPELSRRGPVRDQSLQLDRDSARRLDPLRRADALCVWLHRPVHDRWPDRPVPRRASDRRPRHRYVLRRRPFPLRHGRRRGDGLFRAGSIIGGPRSPAAVIPNIGRASRRSSPSSDST